MSKKENILLQKLEGEIKKLDLELTELRRKAQVATGSAKDRADSKIKKIQSDIISVNKKIEDLKSKIKNNTISPPF
jgi:predicted  nucleic acid-binding Zn-ribbon protein